MTILHPVVNLVLLIAVVAQVASSAEICSGSSVNESCVIDGEMASMVQLRFKRMQRDSTCDFEQDSTDNTYCAFWTNLDSDAFDWTRRSGRTPSCSTGPSSAGSGNHYMYTEASNKHPGDTAALQSPLLTLRATSKLKFLYHMNGRGIGRLMVVFQETASGPALTETAASGGMVVWERESHKGNIWLSADVSLAPCAGKTGVLQVIGVMGDGCMRYSGDIAIDSVTFEAGSPTSAPATNPVPVASTCGGDAGGAACRFPFAREGLNYIFCTSAGHHQPWCHTTNDGWGHCNCEATCGGDSNTAPCKFPFVYKGVEYDSCTSADHDQPWCYTVKSDKLVDRYGNCNCDAQPAPTPAPGPAPVPSTTPTCGGTAGGAPCKPSFYYEGMEYSTCTSQDHNQPWCYTTNGKWGNCNCEVQPETTPALAPAPQSSTAPTCGGDAGGAPCEFPFRYNGVDYSSCTSEDHSEPWCYTTAAGKWGNCNCQASATPTQAQKDAILQKHNNLRAGMGASDMRMMTWDDALATNAQQFATGCPSGHSQRPTGVGENLAWKWSTNFQLTGTTDFTPSVQRWYDERNDAGSYKNGGQFNGFDECSGVCGHYTQVVWAEADLLGCGVAYCPHSEGMGGYALVCQYGSSSGHGGNLIGSTLFTKGSPCSDCPADFSTCSNNLCSSGA